MDQRELKKLSLLAEVATDYYVRGLTQNEIADKLFLGFILKRPEALCLRETSFWAKA